MAHRSALEFHCEAIELLQVFDLVLLIDFALDFSARVECLGQPLQAWEGSHEAHFVPRSHKTSTPDGLRVCIRSSLIYRGGPKMAYETTGQPAVRPRTTSR